MKTFKMEYGNQFWYPDPPNHFFKREDLEKYKIEPQEAEEFKKNSIKYIISMVVIHMMLKMLLVEKKLD
jgi:hypothetical protein